MSVYNNIKQYKKIILNTEDGETDSYYKCFKFRGFNSISITKPSYLKIDAVSADISTDAVYTFKLDNVKFNKSCYYNSDQNAIPTILTRCFNGKSSMMIDNYALKIEPQEITEIVLLITDEDNNGISSTKMRLELCIEEIGEE